MCCSGSSLLPTHWSEVEHICKMETLHALSPKYRFVKLIRASKCEKEKMNFEIYVHEEYYYIK